MVTLTDDVSHGSEAVKEPVDGQDKGDVFGVQVNSVQYHHLKKKPVLSPVVVVLTPVVVPYLINMSLKVGSVFQDKVSSPE